VQNIGQRQTEGLLAAGKEVPTRCPNMISIHQTEIDWEVECVTAYKLRSSSARKLF
jgi:hypothetical protein